jgi:trk system potassium uptake protein
MPKQDDRATGRLVFRVPGVPALRLPILVPKTTNPFSTMVLLVYCFGAVILTGTIFLMLPISNRIGSFTSPIDALFTAVSAVCVTGLVVVDTGTYWSTFGQAVLLVLFQIGGFGFITVTTIVLIAIGGKFGLRERLAVSESLGLERLGGILGIVVKIAIFSLIVEGIGAVLFYIHWLIVGETNASLWTAVFHAVSAFNNCGMDIFGNYQSLIGYQNDTSLLILTAVLIYLGSIGYVVVMEYTRRRNFFKLSLDSKLVIIVSVSLIALGTLFYFISEYSNPGTLGPLSVPQKITVAFFQSVSPRTAGFAAVDVASFRQVTLFFTMLLMFIGGASGSAAGGIKVNTFGIILLTIISSLRGRSSIEAFGRQVSKTIVFRAVTLTFIFVLTVGVASALLSVTEDFPLESLLFETFSAMSTVGLSTGITPDLSVAGRLIVTVTMFIGRLGPLLLVAFLVKRHQISDIEYPSDNIRIG